MSRPETGTMRFGQDWTGIFIRGDDAFNFSLSLSTAIRVLKERASVDGWPYPITLAALEGLRDVLAMSNEIRRPAALPNQQLKPYDACVESPV